MVLSNSLSFQLQTDLERQPYFHALLKSDPTFLDEEIFDPQNPKFLTDATHTVTTNAKIIRNVVDENQVASLLAKVRSVL